MLVGGGGRNGLTPDSDEPSVEFYSPPYLFRGPRPTISAAPRAIRYGTSFWIATPDAAHIASVALMRPGSVTHAFNEDQLFVPLAFTPGIGGLTIQAPATGNVAPPGYYMIFIVDANGVPSMAPFASVGP